MLSDALDAPALLDNDVNASLRGEVSTGSIAGARDALAITLGTGVGGALWMAGERYDGPHGTAGEIGHLPGFGDALCTCGGHGHLETLASGRARSLPGTSRSAVAPRRHTKWRTARNKGSRRHGPSSPTLPPPSRRES